MLFSARCKLCYLGLPLEKSRRERVWWAGLALARFFRFWQNDLLKTELETYDSSFPCSPRRAFRSWSANVRPWRMHACHVGGGARCRGSRRQRDFAPSVSLLSPRLAPLAHHVALRLHARQLYHLPTNAYLGRSACSRREQNRARGKDSIGGWFSWATLDFAIWLSCYTKNWCYVCGACKRHRAQRAGIICWRAFSLSLDVSPASRLHHGLATKCVC